MKLEDFNSKELIFVDIDSKIVDYLVEQIEKVPEDRMINWNDFRNYCIEIGDNNDNILTIPISTLDRLIKIARKKSKYWLYEIKLMLRRQLATSESYRPDAINSS